MHFKYVCTQIPLGLATFSHTLCTYSCISVATLLIYIFVLHSVSLPYHIHWSFHFMPAGTGSCSAETTDLLSWPNTSAGTTWSLHCPTTTTIINRTCSSSGVWESVDLSLCTPFTSINPVGIIAMPALGSNAQLYSLQTYMYYMYRTTSHLTTMLKF